MAEKSPAFSWYPRDWFASESFNVLPLAAQAAYLGQWDRVIVARWTDALMEIDGSRLFHRDISELRAIVQVDVAAPTPTAVCRIRGVRGHLEG